MKQMLHQLAAYHVWANEKIIAAVSALPTELINQPVESSFASLRLTIFHLWQTEFVWWQRLHLAENIVYPANNIELSIEEILTRWNQQSLQLQDWVIKAKDLNLQHVFAYMNSKREQFKQPVYQVLLHVFNHATYHRGQVITLIRQLGIEKIPATDFIVWSRNVK